VSSFTQIDTGENQISDLEEEHTQGFKSTSLDQNQLGYSLTKLAL